MPKSSSKRPGRSGNLWDKVDESVLVPDGGTESALPTPKETLSKWQARRRRWHYTALDGAGLLVWSYLLVKVFIFDIDRWVLETIDPRLTPLLDYRLFAYLALMAVLVVVSSKVKKNIFALHTLYILGFPFVIVLWKIPKAIYKRKSWLVTFSTFNVAATAVSNFKFYVVLYAIGAQSMLLVLAADSRSFLIAATGAMIILTIVLMARAIRLSLQRSSFLTMQRTATVAFIKWTQSYAGLQPRLKNPEIRKFDKTQLELFRDRLSFGLCVTKAAQFWAYQLDEYRKSGISALFAVCSYIWLFVEVWAGATFINLGLLKIAPNAFSYDTFPDLVRVAHYSLSALAINGVDDIKPVGTVAFAAKLALGLAGVLLLTTLIAHLIVNHRKNRQENDYKRTLTEVRSAANALESKLHREYQVSPKEAVERLRRMGGTVHLVIIDFISRRLPDSPT